MSRGKQRVVTEAIVRRILWDEHGATRGVEFSDAQGRIRRARARVVVLCASPVESIRLVLTDPTRAIDDRVPLIGRGLVDHLAVSFVAVAPVPMKRGGASSPSFVPRFVNVEKRRRRAYRGGFSLEADGPVSATELDPGMIAVLGMSPRESRASSFYTVSALGDAMPHPDRFVELHPRDTDKLGRAVPVVHQAWSNDDRRMSEDMMDSVLAAIDAITPDGSVIAPIRDPRRHRALFHEAGGLAMGADPKTSVTDPWGRLRGVRGLYVADASIFPTGGDCFPTLTILALAARTAHQIIESARRGER
jgi:choline dehydrogenase-like flavoprotein